MSKHDKVLAICSIVNDRVYERECLMIANTRGQLSPHRQRTRTA
jgi:hypothetical protein